MALAFATTPTVLQSTQPQMLIFLSALSLLFPLTFFGLKRRMLPWATVLHGVVVSVASGWVAWNVLSTGRAFHLGIPYSFWGSNLEVYVDSLSAFFILTINLTVLTGEIFAIRYIEHYKRATLVERRIHFFSLSWLHLSMVLVTVFQNAFSFLLVWEIMAVSSFMLVIFDSSNREATAAGIKYLIQMHIGALLILFGFLVLYTNGLEMDFRALHTYFESHKNWPLALLFFAGFGIKAGFIPLHTWLPHAHPSAPSHVSGIMSGVMIKLGIYGILRVVLHLQADFLTIGATFLIVSVGSALLGVILAIVQHDLKRLLAYHSIENIGIIGIGIALGVIAIGLDKPVLASLAFAGAILHVFNHSLFKSLLFYGAGAIQFRTHTLNLERLGGLGRKMPQTAFLFLIGAAAISGLPPLNGFVSEFLIYSGLVQGLGQTSIDTAVLLLAAIAGLALVGGLAVFCFTKAFGIIFLGSARSPSGTTAFEVPVSMRIPQFVIAGFILFVGLFPAVALRPVAGVVASLSRSPEFSINSPALGALGFTGFVFILIASAIFAARFILLRRRAPRTVPTWGCGYGAPNARMQYTASSYAHNVTELADPVLDIAVDYEPIPKSVYFPQDQTFATHPHDPIEHRLLVPSVRKLSSFIQMAGVMQTGRVHHYVLYAFVYILLLFGLSFAGVLG